MAGLEPVAPPKGTCPIKEKISLNLLPYLQNIKKARFYPVFFSIPTLLGRSRSNFRFWQLLICFFCSLGCCQFYLQIDGLSEGLPFTSWEGPTEHTLA